jgi:Putative Ig domain
MHSSIRSAQQLAIRTAFAVLLSILSSSVIAGGWSFLTISGAPPTSGVTSQPYSFQPTVTSHTGRTLTFSISDKPVWASFDTTTGMLWGTPQTVNAGTYSNIVIGVTDGHNAAELSAFTITVTALASTDIAPTISGTPGTQVVAGTAYSFRPTASDADGDTLTFSATNVPSWASFSVSTGTLSGTPAAVQVGTYNNIQISVSDGKGGSASLAAFSITVAQITTGNATVSWMPPTQNTDGSTLTNVAGYKIYYGTTQGGPYSASVSITNPSVTTYLVENLTPATYYFVVTASNAAGAESLCSNEASKIIS